jgi:hypothetical protein
MKLVHAVLLLLVVANLVDAEKVLHYDSIVLGGGGAGAPIAVELIDDGQSVALLEAKRKLGGPVDTVNGSDFGVQAYMNTSSYEALGFNFPFNQDEGGMLGFVERFVGPENIEVFPALGYQAPYVTIDPSYIGSLKFTFNSGNLTAENVEWLYNNLTGLYPDLIFQPGFPDNITDSLLVSITAWFTSDPAYAKFIPMVEDSCRTGGFDPDIIPVMYLHKDLAPYLVAFLETGRLFRVKVGNQFYYDQMASFIQSSAGSDIFFGATVTNVHLNEGNGPVSVAFTTADGKHRVLHAKRLVWAIPPTPAKNLALIDKVPDALAAACADMIAHPNFYALKLKENANPFGIPVVSVTNESASLGQPAPRGLVYLYNNGGGVWGGMAWSNNPNDTMATVTQLAHMNLTAINTTLITVAPGVQFPLNLDLDIKNAWKHADYFAHFPIDKIHRYSYRDLNNALCVDPRLVVVGNAPGHSDTSLLLQKGFQTLTTCGVFSGPSRRMAFSGQEEDEDEYTLAYKNRRRAMQVRALLLAAVGLRAAELPTLVPAWLNGISCQHSMCR